MTTRHSESWFVFRAPLHTWVKPRAVDADTAISLCERAHADGWTEDSRGIVHLDSTGIVVARTCTGSCAGSQRRPRPRQTGRPEPRQKTSPCIYARRCLGRLPTRAGMSRWIPTRSRLSRSTSPCACGKGVPRLTAALHSRACARSICDRRATAMAGASTRAQRVRLASAVTPATMTAGSLASDASRARPYCREAAQASCPNLARERVMTQCACDHHEWPMGELSTHDPFSLTGLTYDDVLLTLSFSSFDTSSQLDKNISLRVRSCPPPWLPNHQHGHRHGPPGPASSSTATSPSRTGRASPPELSAANPAWLRTVTVGPDAIGELDSLCGPCRVSVCPS